MLLETFSKNLRYLHSKAREAFTQVLHEKKFEYNARYTPSPEQKLGVSVSEDLDELIRLATEIKELIELGDVKFINTYDRSKWQSSQPTKEAQTVTLGSTVDKVRYLNERNFRTQKVLTKLEGTDFYVWFNKMADNPEDEILHEVPQNWDWGIVNKGEFVDKIMPKE